MGDARKVVVSALQFACSNSVSENVDTAERLVRAAQKKGANIVLIQELFEGYYFCQAQGEDFSQRAKPYKEHPTIVRMQKVAKELGVVIPVNFFEESNSSYYNSIAVIDADGTDLGLYRKSHSPDGSGYKEKSSFNPGDTGLKVFTTKFAKIGVAICWDQWSPEAARNMVLQGAEILLYPTAIGSSSQYAEVDSCEHWRRVMQGHAGANLVPVVASNRIGKETIKTEHGDSVTTFYGNSFIAGPTGELVASSNDKDEDILIAEFDLNKMKSKRDSWGLFQDWRPDVYQRKSQSTAIQTTPKDKKKGKEKATDGIKAKAIWDAKSHQIFMELCLKEIRAGNRPGTHFTKKGWNNLLSKFNKATRKDYDRLQLKNHWDVMKKDWTLWDSLVRSEPGLGWDYEKQTVAASDEWWDKRIKLNPEVAKFQNRSLEQFKTMDQLFLDITANIVRPWAPAAISSMLPSQGSQKSFTGEGYNDNDASESDGGSENVEVNHTTEIINAEIVNGSAPTTSEPLMRKRQNENSLHSKKRKKFSAAKELSKQISRICDVMENMSSSASVRVDSPTPTISHVINLLLAIPGMVVGSDLYNFACSLLMKREAREVFVAQPSKAAQRSWLIAEQDRQRHHPTPSYL